MSKVYVGVVVEGSVVEVGDVVLDALGAYPDAVVSAGTLEYVVRKMSGHDQ